ncbi:hypothetical protein [Singulisphaera sp. PoT]|uniref:hypothetical protein n=1 Tax=Singulisphaera sp. PoT TaxID=3411797 RepID=UPI003BF5F818
MRREFNWQDGDDISLAIEGLPRIALPRLDVDEIESRAYDPMAYRDEFVSIDKFKYCLATYQIYGEAFLGNLTFEFVARPPELSLGRGKQRATFHVASGRTSYVIHAEVDRRLSVEWEALAHIAKLVGNSHYRWGDPIWNLMGKEFIRELVQRYLRQFPRSDFRLALDLVELEDLAAEGNRRA